jgi:hypothetical protein
VQQAVTSPERSPEQRRRIRRNAVLLVLVALGIYVAFIVSSMMKAQP